MAIDPILRKFAELAIRKGLLSTEDAARIAAHAQSKGMQFTDAAHEMGVLPPIQILALEASVAEMDKTLLAQDTDRLPVVTDPRDKDKQISLEQHDETGQDEYAQPVEETGVEAIEEQQPAETSEEEQAGAGSGQFDEAQLIEQEDVATGPFDEAEKPSKFPAAPSIPTRTSFWSFHDRVITRKKIDERYKNEYEMEAHDRIRVSTFDDIDFHRTILMKRLLPAKDLNPKKAEAFLHEALVTGQLEHPNIVPAYDVGILSNGELFFTTKLARGRSLAAVLGALRMGSRSMKKSYPQAKLLAIFEQACRGIAYAHARGIIHRNLNPDNIMIGDFGEVFVTEWGQARIIGEPDIRREVCEVEVDAQAGVVLNGEGNAVEGLAYMPPEQVGGDIDSMDNRSDIYSLGAILYEILTLNRPFIASSQIQLAQRILDTNPVNPTSAAGGRQFPAELAAVTIKAMAKEKNKRYLSIEELRSEVDVFLGGSMSLTVGDTLSGLISYWAKENNRAAVVAAILLLSIIGLGAGGFFWLQMGKANAEKKLAGAISAKDASVKAFETVQGKLSGAQTLAKKSTERLAKLYVRLGSDLIKEGKAGDGMSFLAEATRFRKDLPIIIKGGWEYAIRPVPHLNISNPLSDTEAHSFLSGYGRTSDYLVLEYTTGELRLLDLWTGKRRSITTLEPKTGLRMQVSPDGRYVAKILARPNQSSIIVVIESATGKKLLDVPGSEFFFTESGSNILIANGEQDLAWFDLPAGSEIWRQKSPNTRLRMFFSTPNNRYGAFLFENENISVRNLSDGNQIIDITPEVPSVRSVHLGSTGKHLAVVYNTGRVRIIGLPNGVPGDVISSAKRSDFSVQSNGNFLLLTRSDGVWAWNLENGRRVELMTSSSDIMPVTALSRRGAKAAIAFGVDFEIWDLVHAAHVFPPVDFQKEIKACMFSSDSNLVVAKIGEDEPVIFNLTTGMRYEFEGERAEFTGAEPGLFCLWHNEGRSFSVWSTREFAKGAIEPGNYRKLWGFVPGGRRAILWTAEDSVLWNPKTGGKTVLKGHATVESDSPPELTLQARRFPVGPRVIPGDDPFAASGGDFGLRFFCEGRFVLVPEKSRLKLVDLDSDLELVSIDRGSVVAVSPDGKRIAVINPATGTCTFYNPGNPDPILQFDKLIGAISAVFSADGNRLVVATSTTSGRSVNTIDLEHSSRTPPWAWPLDANISFSPDLKRVLWRTAKNRKQVEMITTDIHRSIAKLENAEGDVWAAHLAPDGSSALLQVTSKSGESHLAFWDLGKTVQLIPVDLDIDSADSLPSRDGKIILFVARRGLVAFSFEKRKKLCEMSAEKGERYLDARLSHDCKWLYLQVKTSDGTHVRLYTFPDGKAIVEPVLAAEFETPAESFIIPLEKNLKVLTLNSNGKPVCYDLAEEYAKFTELARETVRK